MSPRRADCAPPRSKPGGSGAIDVLPACEEPLPTIQYTVFADAYGSLPLVTTPADFLAGLDPDE
jgi:hypothetical protein